MIYRTIERVVFMQGDDADEALAILDNKGVSAALEHLKQWHHPGEHETDDDFSTGPDDRTLATSDGYTMSWNMGLNYIGLEFEVQS